jgi:hypothetical protein
MKLEMIYSYSLATEVEREQLGIAFWAVVTVHVHSACLQREFQTMTLNICSEYYK